MSRVSKAEFEEYYRAFLVSEHSEGFGFMLLEAVLAAAIRLADDSGYIDDLSPVLLYEAHVNGMDEESQEINRGRYNNFVAIAMMEAEIQLMKLGYIEHQGRGDRASAWLCLPDKEA